jgi:hypothetical protein
LKLGKRRESRGRTVEELHRRKEKGARMQKDARGARVSNK